MPNDIQITCPGEGVSAVLLAVITATQMPEDHQRAIYEEICRAYEPLTEQAAGEVLAAVQRVMILSERFVRPPDEAVIYVCGPGVVCPERTKIMAFIRSHGVEPEFGEDEQGHYLRCRLPESGPDRRRFVKELQRRAKPRLGG